MRHTRIIISIHDVTAAKRAEVAEAVSMVQECCGVSPALLVVPNFHDRSPLGENREFVSDIRGWQRDGSEILLHGFYHRAADDAPTRVTRRIRAALLTAGEGEFLDLSPTEIRARLTAGTEALEVLDGAPIGFVAPAWLYNRHLFTALRDAGLALTEGHLFIYHLPTGQRFAMPAMSFCGRGAVRGTISAGFAATLARMVDTVGLPDFRLALHPTDFTHPHLVSAIRELLLRCTAHGDWIRYTDLMPPADPIGAEAP